MRRISEVDLERMKALKAEGKSYKEIGLATGFSLFAVYRKINNKKYYKTKEQNEGVADLSKAQEGTEQPPALPNVENSG